METNKHSMPDVRYFVNNTTGAPTRENSTMFGAINAAPNQPAERLTNNAESDRKEGLEKSQSMGASIATKGLPVNEKRYWPLVIIILVTILAFVNIFRNGFAIDDHVFVGKYHPSITEAFRGAVPPGHEGVYRPIRGVIYTAYFSLFGTNPFFYHLHSLLVHLMATVLVFLIVSVIASDSLSLRDRSDGEAIPYNRMRSPRRFATYRPVHGFAPRDDNGWNGLAMTAGVAALLFGLHPIHTESITYIASSMDVTGIVFFLAAFWLYVRSPRRQNGLAMTASVVFALLAFFTYEMTITLPLVIVLYEFLYGGVVKKAVPYGIGATAYVGIRFFLLGITSRGVYLGGSVYYTLLTLPKVLMHYLWVTIWPVQLVNNHIISPGIEAFVYRGYRTAAILSQSILDPEILFSIGVIGGIGVIGWKLRKTMPLVSFGIAWFFVTLLPVMGFVPQGSIFNERMLYLPSVGFVTVLAYVIFNFQFSIFKRKIFIVFLIGLLYGVRTISRNFDWKDDVTLWQKDVAAAPTQNAYAYYALGNAYYNRKELDRAAAAYEQSVAINPGFAVGYASLSRLWRDMGDVARSNAYYQKADEAEPGFWTHP